MNTLALAAFTTAAEENSFSLAAEKLHLTQPGISKRIVSLEDQLGCRLFDRIGRRIQLTEAGKTFLPHAYKMLQDAQSGLNAVRNLSHTIDGFLSIATTQHIGLHHLAQPVKRYIIEYEEVAFNLDFLTSKQAYADVLQGKLELAVITEPTQMDEQLRFIPLWTEKLKFVCAKDHHLASLSSISLKDLSSVQGILPDASSFTRRVIDDIFEQANLSIIPRAASNYLEAIKMLVTAGLGWSVLPDSLIDDNLKILDLDNSPLKRQIGCLIHQDRTESNAASAFIKLLQSYD